MATPVEQIKERLSIEDVVSTYLKLEPSGVNLRARCPFHSEKTPSFFVSPLRGSYYCFGCGAKGDIFSFVERFEGLDFKGALKTLADRAGVTLTYAKEEDQVERDVLYKIMEEATRFYEQTLEATPFAQAYIEKRGVNQKTREAFRIGYAPKAWRELATYLEKKGFSRELLETAGLAKKTETGFYDRFRGRIMFPIKDSTGRVIAFSGRLLEDDGVSAKYVNSPETPLFDKSATLYGIDKAKEAIRKRGFSILVEGQFDIILAHQAGSTNTVASSGTALSESGSEGDGGMTSMKMLSRLSKNIVLGFDGDNAGQKAILRAGKIALGLDMDVKVITLPGDTDPADVIQESKEMWIELLKHTTHIISYSTSRIVAKEKDARVVGKYVREYVLPLVAVIKSSIDQSHFIKVVSDLSGIAEYALLADLKIVAGETSKQTILPASIPLTKKTETSDHLYGVIFWQETLKEREVNIEYVKERIESIVGKERALTLHDAALEKKDELIFETENVYQGRGTIAKDIELLLAHLEEHTIREKMFTLTKQIKQCESSGEDPGVPMANHQELAKRLEELIHTRNF